MKVYHREKLDCSQFAGIGLAIHEAFDHLDDLLLQIFDVDKAKDMLDGVNRLVAHS